MFGTTRGVPWYAIRARILSYMPNMESISCKPEYGKKVLCHLQGLGMAIQESLRYCPDSSHELLTAYKQGTYPCVEQASGISPCPCFPIKNSCYDMIPGYHGPPGWSPVSWTEWSWDLGDPSLVQRCNKEVDWPLHNIFHQKVDEKSDIIDLE